MGATVVVTAAADKFAPFYATAAVHQSPDLDWRFGFLDFMLAITTTAPFKICELALPFWERLSEPSGASASASVVPAAQLDPTVQQALLRASDIVSRRTAYPADYHAWPEGRRADFIEFRDSVRQTLRKLVATVGVSRSDCRVRFGSAPLDGHSAREGGLPASQLCESSTRQSAPAASRRLPPRASLECARVSLALAVGDCEAVLRGARRGWSGRFRGLMHDESDRRSLPWHAMHLSPHRASPCGVRAFTGLLFRGLHLRVPDRISAERSIPRPTAQCYA